MLPSLDILNKMLHLKNCLQRLLLFQSVGFVDSDNVNGNIQTEGIRAASSIME